MKNSLINRFLNHQHTREELQQLHEEVNLHEDEVMKSIEKDWDSFQCDKNIEWSDKHWAQLQEKMVETRVKDNPSTVFQLSWIARVAASILVIAGVWFAIDLKNEPETSSNDDPSLLTEANDTEEPSIVILKDGTKVTLTAHSSISYYDNFNHRYRVVHLEGEAFFETDKENKRPFIVISDNITSICRGEEFSISAYQESDEINVTLASGQIEISRNDKLNSENNKIAVKSCQRYSFSKSTNEYLIGKISDCEYDEKARSMREAAKKNIVML